MTKQILLRSPALMVEKRQPLLQNGPCGNGHRKLAEVAGGTAAGCAAVCCCCPCGLVHLIVLAMYKVPARLCRKALRRRRRKKQALLPRKKCSCDDKEFEIQSIKGAVAMLDAMEANKMKNNKEIVELDKEMWDKFYGAGFWRSNSQRSDISA